MSEVEVLPELKQIIGAMLFAAKAPLSLGEMRRILQQTGEVNGGPYKEFASLKEPDIAAAVQQLGVDLIQARVGVHVSEIATGFRLNNDSGCGPWLRILLDKGRAQRLSKPALETLAIIAYRQPVTRGEIEGVRGVQVDAIIRNLMEMQLIKIVGRSELPGRPWLFGTTQKFLESFGLKDMEDLPSIQELRRIQTEQEEREIAAAAERVAAESQAQIDLNEKPAAESNAAGAETAEIQKSEEAVMGVGREDIDRDYEGEREEDFEEEEAEEEKEEAETEEVEEAEEKETKDEEDEDVEKDEDDEEYSDDDFEDDSEDEEDEELEDEEIAEELKEEFGDDEDEEEESEDEESESEDEEDDDDEDDGKSDKSKASKKADGGRTKKK